MSTETNVDANQPSVEPKAEETHEPTAAAPEQTTTDAPAAETAPVSTEAAATDAPKETSTADKATSSPINRGVLGYKAPGIIHQLRFSNKFFWLGDESISHENLKGYQAEDKSGQAHHNISWASHTGNGLLLFVKREEDKEKPQGVINLSDASDVTAVGEKDFSFKHLSGEHTFRAASGSDRDAWVVAIESAVQHAKGSSDEVTGHQNYKDTMEKLKPAAIVGGVGAAGVATAGAVKATSDKPNETAPESDKENLKPAHDQSRSASRSKRSSVFGFIGGKKDEKSEDKKDEAKDEDAKKDATPEVAAMTSEEQKAAEAKKEEEAKAAAAKKAEEKKAKEEEAIAKKKQKEEDIKAAAAKKEQEKKVKAEKKEAEKKEKENKKAADKKAAEAKKEQEKKAKAEAEEKKEAERKQKAADAKEKAEKEAAEKKAAEAANEHSKKEEELAAGAGAVAGAGAGAAAVTAVEGSHSAEPVSSDAKKDDITPNGTTNSGKQSKRTSVFGKFFNRSEEKEDEKKVEDVTDKKDEDVAPPVPAKDEARKELPVTEAVGDSKTADVTPVVNGDHSSTPAAKTDLETAAVAPAPATTSEKRRSIFGLGKKDAESTTKSTEATEAEKPEAAKSGSRFSELLRRPSKALRNVSQSRKEKLASSPAAVPETESAAVTGKTTDTTSPAVENGEKFLDAPETKAEQAAIGDEQTNGHSIGDVVPEAVNAGHTPTAPAEVRATA